MKFSVIDKQTLQCIMTEEEIAHYGMDRRALYRNDGRVQDFFRQIMQRAKQETGFAKERGDVAVHASFLSDELLEITFSLRQADAENNGPVGEALDVRTAVFKAKGIADMAAFSRQAPAAPDASLYRYKEQYFLLVSVAALGQRQTAQLFHCAEEYVDEICCAPGIAAFLKEHGTPIIAENAIRLLRSL